MAIGGRRWPSLGFIVWCELGFSLLRRIPPLLYKVLGTHQRSKKHEIRGQYGKSLYVLEICFKKGVFAQKSSRFRRKKKEEKKEKKVKRCDIFYLEASEFTKFFKS